MAARSTRLAQGRISGINPGVVIYTVPPLKVALVKVQRYANFSASALNHSTYFKPGGGTRLLVYTAAIGSLSFSNDNLQHVLMAGDQIEVSGGTLAGHILDYWISGSLLDA